MSIAAGAGQSWWQAMPEPKPQEVTRLGVWQEGLIDAMASLLTEEQARQIAQFYRWGTSSKVVFPVRIGRYRFTEDEVPVGPPTLCGWSPGATHENAVSYGVNLIGDEVGSYVKGPADVVMADWKAKYDEVCAPRIQITDTP